MNWHSGSIVSLTVMFFLKIKCIFNFLFLIRRRMKNKRRQGAISEGRPAYLPQGQFAPRAVGSGYNPKIVNAHQEILVTRQQAFVRESGNKDAAVALRAMLRSEVG